jgi:hypothetical protein
MAARGVSSADFRFFGNHAGASTPACVKWPPMPSGSADVRGAQARQQRWHD